MNDQLVIHVDVTKLNLSAPVSTDMHKFRKKIKTVSTSKIKTQVKK